MVPIQGAKSLIDYGQRSIDSILLALKLHVRFELSLIPNRTSNHFRLFANTRSDYAIQRYINETRRLYSVLESRLKESSYLAGEKYTIADIASFSWVRGAPVSLETDLSEDIDKRAAVQKGVDVPHSNRTSEQKAEIFRNFRTQIDAMTTSDQH